MRIKALLVAAAILTDVVAAPLPPRRCSPAAIRRAGKLPYPAMAAAPATRLGNRRGARLVGPPLTGIRNRIYIAGMLQNKPQNLVLWIRDPKW